MATTKTAKIVRPEIVQPEVVSANEVKTMPVDLIASKIFVVDVSHKVFEEKRTGNYKAVREEILTERINLYISVRDLPDNDIAAIHALASAWVENKNSDLVEYSILGITVMADHPYQQYVICV